MAKSKTKNITTVGQLVDKLVKLPRGMKLWVGMPNGTMFNPCHIVSHVSADPEGDPEHDDCGIILDPDAPYSNAPRT